MFQKFLWKRVDFFGIVEYHHFPNLILSLKGRMCKDMFQNDRYITRGIKEKINDKNPVTYLVLWGLIDDMDIPDNEKDYLQVFVLRAKSGRRKMQEIEHFQEEPPYKRIHRFYTECPVNARVYVIDDGANSVMLLAEEY
jgi:hypothetical protein